MNNLFKTAAQYFIGGRFIHTQKTECLIWPEQQIQGVAPAGENTNLFRIDRKAVAPELLEHGPPDVSRYRVRPDDLSARSRFHYHGQFIDRESVCRPAARPGRFFRLLLFGSHKTFTFVSAQMYAMRTIIRNSSTQLFFSKIKNCRQSDNMVTTYAFDYALSKIRKKDGVSLLQIARDIGEDRAVLDNMRRGRAAVKPYIYERIISKHPKFGEYVAEYVRETEQRDNAAAGEMQASIGAIKEDREKYIEYLSRENQELRRQLKEFTDRLLDLLSDKSDKSGTYTRYQLSTYKTRYSYEWGN